MADSDTFWQILAHFLHIPAQLECYSVFSIFLGDLVSLYAYDSLFGLVLPKIYVGSMIVTKSLCNFALSGTLTLLDRPKIYLKSLKHT